MKIKGSIPRALMTKSKGQIVVKVKGHLKGQLLGQTARDQTMVVQKWPRKRTGKVPPITAQQQTTWDQVQADIKFPDPGEFQLAIDATQGTAFYTRDILILAMYGHYLSWPGWGPYPQGCLIFPSSLGLTEGGGMKNRPLGLPQKVNSISTLTVDDSGDPVKIDVTTKRPADAELAIWCCDPNPCLKFKKTLGEFLPHGYKLFLPCDPTYFVPDRSEPGAYGWDIPCSALECSPCHFAIIERSITPPIVEWTSLLHDCPSCGPTPPPPFPCGDFGPFAVNTATDRGYPENVWNFSAPSFGLGVQTPPIVAGTLTLTGTWTGLATFGDVTVGVGLGRTDTGASAPQVMQGPQHFPAGSGPFTIPVNLTLSIGPDGIPGDYTWWFWVESGSRLSAGFFNGTLAGTEFCQA